MATIEKIGNRAPDSFVSSLGEDKKTNEAGGDRTVKFWAPDQVHDDYSINIANTDIIGRSAPHTAYVWGGVRTISVDVEFHSSWLGGKAADTVKNVEKKVELLRSFQYPDYQNQETHPPERLILQLVRTLNIICICTQAKVTWIKPITEDGKFCHAKVSLVFQEIVDTPKSRKSNDILTRSIQR